MGLVAREIEQRGIPTVCLSSAFSITAAVNPPRAVFVDFPLGHTAGKRHDKPLQRRIMIDTLSALDGIQRPGSIHVLPYRWSDSDDWKHQGERPSDDAPEAEITTGPDDRQTRTDAPQYQHPEDREAAEGQLPRPPRRC